MRAGTAGTEPDRYGPAGSTAFGRVTLTLAWGCGDVRSPGSARAAGARKTHLRYAQKRKIVPRPVPMTLAAL
jgi:hypothetical protein